MPEPKYELRSEQAEELMNKAPHSFVLWGNTFILAILVTGVFLLSRIDLADYDTVSAVVRKVGGIGAGGKQYVEVGCQLYKYPVETGGQLITVQFSRKGGQVANVLRGRVIAIQKLDSLHYAMKVLPVATLRAGAVADLPDSGMVCSAKIMTGKRNILFMIRQELRGMISHH